MVCGPSFGSPTRFGRLAANPEIGGLFACSATLAESDTVNGVPEFIVAMALICQPPKMCRTVVDADAGTLGSQLALATNRWRASNNEGPYSAPRSNGFCARSFSPASGLAAAPDRFMDDSSSIDF